MGYYSVLSLPIDNRDGILFMVYHIARNFCEHIFSQIH